ncbi:MAG TPA: methyltransferase domain-containing protein [Kiritimatiellia bacterium]|jgi:SAM-dependent methyltransferase
MAYDRAFFEQQREGSLRSARVVAPIIIDLVKPRSVVDVGCGVGTWLSAFIEAGVKDVLGLDGAYARESGLVIPDGCFQAADLAAPLQVGRRFDLAVSVEVGEHLPRAAAGTLVDSLTRLAPVVVFSAAVPFQGGTDHVNEQWPDFWAALFRARGYVAVDALRPRIWQDAAVEVFYRQNLLVFADERELARNPALAAARAATSDRMLSVAHPELFSGRNAYPLGSLRSLWPWIVRRTLSALKRGLTRS